MHGRPRVGLRQDEQRAARRRSRGAGGESAAACAGRGAGVAKDAEPRARDGARARRRRRSPNELVVARAEEGEVVLVEPFEEGPALGDLGGGAACGGRLQRVGDLTQAAAHLRPVLDRGADLPEHAGQVRLAASASASASVSRSTSMCNNDSSARVAFGGEDLE